MSNSAFREALFGGIGVAGTVGGLLLAPIWVVLLMAAAVALVVMVCTPQYRLLSAAAALIFCLAGVAALLTTHPSTPRSSPEYRDELEHLSKRIEMLLREQEGGAEPDLESKAAAELIEEIPIRNLAPLRRATVAYINRLRDHHGRASLDESLLLNRRAQQHVRRMIDANQFSHEVEGHFFLDKRIPGYNSFAQVIAESNSGRWTSVISQWTRSKEHRRVLLSPEMTHIGVGIEINSPGPFGHLWTVELAGHKG